jgi:homogentisate 1,2-dioxygenase
MSNDELRYQAGLGNAMRTEALSGALPKVRHVPRKTPYGLHPEQINGTGFTVERALNRRSWLYRLRPQVLDRGFERLPPHPRLRARFDEGVPSPQVMRYRAIAMPREPTDFLDGLTTFAGAGDPSIKRGMAVHLYATNRDMGRVMCNIDGDLLLAPERGRLRILTEMGWIEASTGEIVVIPRGIRFQVQLPDGEARGFAAELFDGHFQLPERGPVGANGLADEQDFLSPVAWFEDRQEDTPIVVKQGGELFRIVSPFSPFDVVAWQGSYAPYKYDLMKFNTLWSVTWDHPDPSILTVLTSPSDTHGRNAIDVAVFKRRWENTEGTFRPPFFHRNSAIEFNAIVKADATTGPWQAGAFSYTPYLSPHGVSASTVERVLAMNDEEADAPHLISDNDIWLQFESTYVLRVMPWMFDHEARDDDYLASFSGYPVGDATGQEPSP